MILSLWFQNCQDWVGISVGIGPKETVQSDMIPALTNFPQIYHRCVLNLILPGKFSIICLFNTRNSISFACVTIRQLLLKTIKNTKFMISIYIYILFQHLSYDIERILLLIYIFISRCYPHEVVINVFTTSIIRR